MNEAKVRLTDYINYIIVVIAALIAGVVPPFLGTVAGLGLCFPTTTAGWIVWSILQICNAVANCLIFYALTAQGKDNAKKMPAYQKAIDLLRVNKIGKEVRLISPQEWEANGWKKKMAWMAISTLVGGVALTQAVLTFDALRFIIQLISITFAILFGLFHMKQTEYKYTDYYLEYAEQQVRLKEEAEEEARLAKEEEDRTTTHYLEITTTSTVERTREIPIKEETTNNVST